ncbi:hypothetical protein IG631_19101 [Alternaria alternata]|nr:hypothetical protein IG631_19101 [Alternaria alternata]
MTTNAILFPMGAPTPIKFVVNCWRYLSSNSLLKLFCGSLRLATEPANRFKLFVVAGREAPLFFVLIRIRQLRCLVLPSSIDAILSQAIKRPPPSRIKSGLDANQRLR